MMTIRRSADRGFADHGWLKSFHTFSFADYQNARHMGLRQPAGDQRGPHRPGAPGFGTHGHRDMEIVSYVLDGALAHKDSMGNGTAIVPGEVQRMTAGSGVRHSEFNHAKDATTHFLQIWILPDEGNLTPGYEQKAFSDADKRGQLKLVAAPGGEDGAVTLNADARIRAGLFDGAESATLALPPGRKTWVHVARGSIRANGQALQTGDAIGLEGEPQLVLDQGSDAEVLVFDLAS